jgi:hypothetical protein
MSSTFMIDLLADGRSWYLLSDNAAQDQERPIAIGLGKRFPEISQGNSLIRLQRARGGTGLGAVCRMVILRGSLVPGESESNPPVSGVPGLQLWRLVPRIDNAELQVRPVCVFGNSFKGSDIGSIDEVTRKLTPLFNPRRHKWSRHFRWESPYLIGITPIGRITVELLKINDPFRVELREELIAEGLFPPT